MARKAAAVSAAVKDVVSEVKVEKIQEPLETSQPIVDVPKVTEKNVDFTKDEKEYILKTISLGYHYKDVLKRAKVYLKLSDEKYQLLSKNVQRIEDIFTNLGV